MGRKNRNPMIRAYRVSSLLEPLLEVGTAICNFYLMISASAKDMVTDLGGDRLTCSMALFP